MPSNRATRKAVRDEQARQEEFFDDIAKEGIAFLEGLPKDPESRLRKMVHLRNCLSSLSGDEPRLDKQVEELDEILDKIARVFRRSLVRHLFAGTLEPEMACKTLKVLQEAVDRGLWPEAESDLDEILGPDTTRKVAAADLRGFGPPEAA